MKNSEKIKMYYNNFCVDKKITNEYKRQMAILKAEYKKPMSLSAKLIVIFFTVISIIHLFVFPYPAPVSIMFAILTAMISTQINDFENTPEHIKKKEKLLEDFNRLGYYPQIKERDFFFNNPQCGDYDNYNECFICSVDGHFISEWNYFHRCNNSNQCVHCKKRLRALAPREYYIQHPFVPIDESISRYFEEV